jgi:hypothetical protein
VVKGETVDWKDISTTFVYRTELYVDGKLVESPELPAGREARRYDLCWNYDLTKGKHAVKLKILNPVAGRHFDVRDIIIYSDKPVDGMSLHTGSK